MLTCRICTRRVDELDLSRHFHAEGKGSNPGAKPRLEALGMGDRTFVVPHDGTHGVWVNNHTCPATRDGMRGAAQNACLSWQKRPRRHGSILPYKQTC